jgi:hypothetical protein
VYASVAWNSITSPDANKLDRIQQRFAALCFNRFFPEAQYNNNNNNNCNKLKYIPETILVRIKSE